jgi:hypothetical protein
MSLTAGTIFQDTHLPLTLWFRAMWQIASQKNGISALRLQLVLAAGARPGQLQDRVGHAA